MARATVTGLWRKLRGDRRNTSFDMGPVLSISDVERRATITGTQLGRKLGSMIVLARNF